MKLVVSKVFSPMFQFSKRLVMLKSGRIGGKSFTIAQLAVFLNQSQLDRDVVLCRNSYADLEKSIYSQVIGYIASQGVENQYEYYKQPLRIINKNNGNIIYFEGIGGSDKSRTRSFVPKHKLMMIAYDELQQVKDEESLLHANASFRRYLDTDKGVIIEAYNPPAQNSHWINIRWNIKAQDPDYLRIESSYLDIVQFVNDMDLRDILKMKLYDFEKYEWFYLGKPGGGFGAVYPQFKREKHFIPIERVIERFGFTQGSLVSDEVKRIRFGMRVSAIVIGGDGAVNRDATTFQPFFIMESGHVIRMEQYYYSPEMYGQKSSYEQMPGILRWFRHLTKHYHLPSDLPIMVVNDSAATELTRMLKINLAEPTQVYSYGKQTIIDMTGVMQSAIASNGVIIADFGGYQDWYGNKWINKDDPLVVALENLVWNDKQTGYEPSVPNDTSDAMTYAINFLKRNPDNIYSISMYNNTSEEYYD